MTPPAQPRNRLVQVDALRGLAALAVVLFHYSTRFRDLYQPASTTAFEVPWGHYGVNLFFIISGFVIFMTLERTQRPMDFIVSRFSRLYPTYWAAIALTFVITHALGLPLKLVDLPTAIKNLPMFHGLFGVAHVDGVYWTLEVELLFYAGMLALFSWGKLGNVHREAIGLLILRWVYFVASSVWGIDLPWILWRVLILQYLPWFALGMSIHTLHVRQGATATVRRDACISAALGLLTLLVTESVTVAALFVVFGLVVFLATKAALPVLQLRALVWLGSISYPLYLLHENIGWSLMLQGHRLGYSANSVVLVTLLLVLVLSHGLSRWVERPAMRWVRDWYKHRQAHRAANAG